MRFQERQFRCTLWPPSYLPPGVVADKRLYQGLRVLTHDFSFFRLPRAASRFSGDSVFIYARW